MKIKISYFNKASDTKPKDILLDDWLKKTIDPPEDLKNKIKQYRKTKNQSLKRSFPAVTISALLKKERNLKNVKKKTNLICIDVDRKSKAKNRPSNTCVDMSLVKELLSKHPSTLFCGYSLSNDGIYCIILLHKSVSLKKAFNYLLKQLRMHGINIDESCKDVTRMRFISYDKNAYWNKKPKPLKIKKEVQKSKSVNKTLISKTDRDKVEAVVQLCESTGIDITSDYSDWVKIGGALGSAFGEGGREYFHRISKNHKEYNRRKTNNKFDSCLKIKKISLSSLFYIANSYGIRY